jgi:hypothetical protein
MKHTIYHKAMERTGRILRSNIINYIIFVFLLGFIPAIGLSQDRLDKEIKNVRAVVSVCAQERRKTNVLFRSLAYAKGRLFHFDDEFFYLTNGKQDRRLSYRDVLEMRCGDSFVSNMPDPSTKPYGKWEDVGRVFAGTRIVVLLEDGKSVRGFSNSATASGLVIVDDKGRERVDIARSRIVSFYGLLGGYGGVKKGASKGAEGMATGGDPLLSGAFAGIGALLGLVKSDGHPILIYSK